MNIFMKLWRYLFPQKAAPKRKKSTRQIKDHYGAHYYMGDLLDKLDQVFKDLPKFRKIDRDAFAAYQRLGATVISSDALIAPKLEPSLVSGLPSFGCVFMGGGNTEKYLGLRFGCFVKETRPINIQSSNGNVYRCTLTYDFNGTPVANQFYISIDGKNIRALKECRPRRVQLGTKWGNSVTRMEWSHSDFLTQICDRDGQTIDQAASEVFSLIANAAYMREAGMTVRVKRGNMSAVFAIDMLRTPYFFADRDRVVNDDGKTKKIIHIVRGHTRHLSDGSEQFVKSHFRGLRRFTWNGYQVRVSMVGTHGNGLSAFNLAAANPIDGPDGTVDMNEVAERIDAIMV